MLYLSTILDMRPRNDEDESDEEDSSEEEGDLKTKDVKTTKSAPSSLGNQPEKTEKTPVTVGAGQAGLKGSSQSPGKSAAHRKADAVGQSASDAATSQGLATAGSSQGPIQASLVTMQQHHQNPNLQQTSHQSSDSTVHSNGNIMRDSDFDNALGSSSEAVTSRGADSTNLVDDDNLPYMDGTQTASSVLGMENGGKDVGQDDSGLSSGGDAGNIKEENSSSEKTQQSDFITANTEDNITESLS